LKILISGSSGLVGSFLAGYLTAKGHEIFRLVRDPKKRKTGDIFWDPVASQLDVRQMKSCHAVIHLAGENLANRLWTKKQKILIRNSRVVSTQFLAKTISHMTEPKPIFLCASATGFYGDRGDEVLDEQSAPGKGFLAEVVREWEAATDEAKNAGVRVVNLRFGVILSRQGGILGRLLPVFRFGLGGKLGNGRQYMPWIVLDDVAGAVDFCLHHSEISGPVNIVAPELITNDQFTQLLAALISRPAFFRIPAGLLRALLGEMADELFFSSTRVEPKVLRAMSYHYRYPQLRTALRSVLT
jgi:uncharacterized protein (TIGR01777 family)